MKKIIIIACVALFSYVLNAEIKVPSPKNPVAYKEYFENIYFTQCYTLESLEEYLVSIEKNNKKLRDFLFKKEMCYYVKKSRIGLENLKLRDEKACRYRVLSFQNKKQLQSYSLGSCITDKSIGKMLEIINTAIEIKKD